MVETVVYRCMLDQVCEEGERVRKYVDVHLSMCYLLSMRLNDDFFTNEALYLNLEMR